MPPRLMRDRQNVFQENELNMKIERRNPTTLNMKAHSGEIDWCLRRVSQLKWNEIVSETRLFNMREGKHKTTNTFNGIKATELKLNENEDEAYRTYRRVHTYSPFNVFFFF